MYPLGDDFCGIYESARGLNQFAPKVQIRIYAHLAQRAVVCPFTINCGSKQKIDMYFNTQGVRIVRFVCCGVLYSTNDPDTYWCIDTYIMKQPSIGVINGKKIAKEIVYTLICKKNGCLKLEIHRYYKENEKLKRMKPKYMIGEQAQKFLETTKDMRIKQPQCCPIQPQQYSKTIPWVYGKTVDGETQIARYLDESGNRNVFKNRKWETELLKTPVKTYTFNSLI